MVKIKDLKFDVLLLTVEQIKKTIYINNKDDVAVQRLVSFFPGIPFKKMMELYPIVLEKNSQKFEEFKNNNPDLSFNPAGTSKYNFKWWEPLLELHETLYTTSKNKDNKSNKDIMIIEAKELNFLNRIEKKYKKDTVFKLIYEFELNYKKDISYNKARIINIYNKLHNKLPDSELFFTIVIDYCKNQSRFKMLDLILSRLEFMLDDKKLKHEANKEYLTIIEDFIKNNSLYYENIEK